MKGIIKILIIIAVFILCPVMNTYATEYEFEQNDETDLYGGLYGDIVKDDLLSSVPSDVNEFINDFGLTPENPLSFNELFTKEGFEKIVMRLANNIALPFEMLSVILTAIIVCALIFGFEKEKSPLSTTFSSFSTLVCVAVIFMPITSLITDCAAVLNALSTFMLSLIPVFSGLLIAAAKSNTALGFQPAVFAATQTVGYVGTNVVTPIMSMFTALSVASGISLSERLVSLVELFKKTAMWTISIAMTVYMSVFSIKNIVSSATENAGVRGARFVISSLVPIVGASINEALSSLKGCVSVLSNSVAIYAVIILIAIALPVLIRVLIWRFIIIISSGFADVFSVSQISKMLKSLGSSLSILCAIIICSVFMFIFSITVLCIASNSI